MVSLPAPETTKPGVTPGLNVPLTVSVPPTLTLALSVVVLPALTVSFLNVVAPFNDCAAPAKVTSELAAVAL